jgi:hypothetical protein
MGSLSLRERLIGAWELVSAVERDVDRHPAFLTSSGDRLAERSRKRTIQRQLDEALADRVSVTRTRHENGWEMDVFRRRQS